MAVHFRRWTSETRASHGSRNIIEDIQRRWPNFRFKKKKKLNKWIRFSFNLGTRE